VRSSENNHLEVFVSLFKAFHDVRPNINACINSFLIREINLKDHIGVLCFNVIDTMDQSLIHVEDHELLLRVRYSGRRKLNE
jgi:hypothetical protein